VKAVLLGLVKNKGVRIAAVALVVAVASYFGLDLSGIAVP
jgi:hypothetical protein